MAFPDDVFPPADRCEICGSQLDNEIVIQEFADGSLARLCNECAVGAALESEEHLGHSLSQDEPEAEVEIPAETARIPIGAPIPAEARTSVDALIPTGGRMASDADPLDRTKELLTPVVDLIGLQREMQTALERLAASLTTFADGVLAEKEEQAATVEDRVESLERELEITRARLKEAEALLAATAAPAAAGTAAAPTTAAASVSATPLPAGSEPPAATQVPPAEVLDWLKPTDEEAPIGADSHAGPAGVPVAPPGDEAWAASAPVIPTAAIDIDATLPGTPPSAEAPRRGFTIEEVQAAQRYFNESPFTGKTRDVQSSLGKPRANLTRAAGPEPRAFITVTWDIVWYQYLVDMRLDVPSNQRVVLHREGMDLDELVHYFKDKNATIDDSGRLDASELEVKLLSDPSALITEMTVDEEKALEDATEEIWDQQTAPEFKWDD